jgi:hypothetical protein
MLPLTTALLLVLFLGAPSYGKTKLPWLGEIKSITIDSKDHEAVYAGEKKFLVTEETVIIKKDRRDKEVLIDLQDLPIPCKVEMKYRLEMDESALATFIILLKPLQGATPWPKVGS